MLGRRRLHRIAYTSSSLAVAREVVLRKAFAWLANLSFLVATFKAHYHKSKAAAVVMRPLCLPGLLFVETIQQLQQRPRWSCWSSTLKLIGRRSELKSRGSFQTPKEAEFRFSSRQSPTSRTNSRSRGFFESFHPAPYVFAAADFNDYDPLNTSATEEYPPMPRMPDHLDSWLEDDI
ncbi:hypothetical protein TYRP_009473 [Tyrophagus putrescentiae]|nr:hypothetical protein TYRP_009473 [Tyrophagus putrescentiae]